MVSGPKTMAASRSDRPAFGIWPDRGERQLCVWCHSSESHQSHTGWNTSVSRTHNCLPLKKHRTDFKNRAIWAQHDWVWSSELMESLSSTFPLTGSKKLFGYHLTRKLDILSSKLKQTLTNVKTAVCFKNKWSKLDVKWLGLDLSREGSSNLVLRLGSLKTCLQTARPQIRTLLYCVPQPLRHLPSKVTPEQLRVRVTFIFVIISVQKILKVCQTAHCCAKAERCCVLPCPPRAACMQGRPDCSNIIIQQSSGPPNPYIKQIEYTCLLK